MYAIPTRGVAPGSPVPPLQGKDFHHPETHLEPRPLLERPQPLLSMLAPTPKVGGKLSRRHKTVDERARRMIA